MLCYAVIYTPQCAIKKEKKKRCKKKRKNVTTLPGLGLDKLLCFSLALFQYLGQEFCCVYYLYLL